MKIGSLFTGTGGLDMAAEAAFGATTAWVSDIDKGACKIIEHRYPDVPNLGDITAIDWSTVEPVDIITGGSPCQDLSHAGKRAGMTEGTRSNLWVAMREGIAQLKPTYVIWENVRGAYSAAADSAVEHCAGCMGVGSGPYLRALGRVLGDLSDLGYDTQWRGLRAADVGAPHGRFRVFVVARLAAHAGSGRGHEAVEHHGRRSQESDRRSVSYERDRDALRAGPDRDLTLLPTPAVNDMGKSYTPEQWDEWTARMKATHGNGNGHGKSLEIEAARLLPTPRALDATGVRGVTPNRSAEANYRAGETLSDVSHDERFGQYAAAIQRWETVTGMPAPAPTEPTGKNGAHRLSPKFTEWMMGLPPGWITDTPGITRNEALKACGNGVVPQQAYAAIVHALDTFALIDTRGAA